MAKKSPRKSATKQPSRKPKTRRADSKSSRPAGSTAKRKSSATTTRASAGGIGSDAVKQATGKTWDQWFSILDKAGAAKKTHKEIAAWFCEQFRGDGLSDWWAQMVTVGYEQARGLREKHQKADGYQISGNKTIGVPVKRLFDAFHDERIRRRWLVEAITIRKATAPKSLRVTWSDGKSHIDVNLYPKGDDRSYVSLQHSKLPNARAAEKMKTYWRTGLERLKALLES